MRFLMAICLVFATTLPAQAISRHYAPSVTCEEIKSTIAREGEAIIRYPSRRTPGLVLYDRFVASGQFCETYEMTERLSVPASDGMCRLRHCVSADECDRLIRPGRCDWFRRGD